MKKRVVSLFLLATLAAAPASLNFADRGVFAAQASESEPAASVENVENVEKVGVRPYEMDWAGRTTDEHEALVDFENLDGWTVETQNAVASFERSREEQLFGKYVGKLTYRADGDGEPILYVRPPRPIPIPTADFDAISCWIVGNNWGWAIDPETPQAVVSAIFKKPDGTDAFVVLYVVDWKEWFLCLKALNSETRESLRGAAFDGFRIENGSNKKDRTLYFDSFCAFKEKREPLEFKPRAKPGIELFPGQPLGINSGDGRLPFPTRDETILPDSAKNLRKPAFHSYGDSFDFVYEGTDGTLVYEYRPQNGDWSDVSARWNESKSFKPLANGGVVQLIGENGDAEPVEKRELIDAKPNDVGVVARWKLTSKTASAEVEYRFQLMGKSLVVDTIARGGKIPAVEFGRVEGIVKPRVFEIPYYLYDYGRRPGTLIFRVPPKKTPTDGTPLEVASTLLFASGHIDWYRSGASYLFGAHSTGADEKGRPFGVVNGAAQYRPKTDGARNDVYERFFLTVSPNFAETLPTIPNPKSPYKDVAGKGVWRARGASDRDVDKAHWFDVWRRGMKHVIVTDHETCWRDGGESFTFRTKPAPGKGGDAGWIDYSRFMQDKLGFVYGPYNNFTDFAPVNEYWSTDLISRLPDGEFQRAWMRCYAPKPTRAVEYCEKLTPINEEKFKFSCAYCDVHSSVPPWTRTDYDARVPGAGTFMSVFYPYGEIFLLQKKNWDGPTYSEGPHHCFYAGLTDGNYAQDQPYNLRVNPWLVDFDLLKMHDLESDFGLGNLGMFAPGYAPKTDEERAALLDRFLTGTVAFGHPGFLALDYGQNAGAKSYFLIQQIAARYTQASVESIQYFDADGKPLDTSAALAADVVKRNQLAVKYADGTVVVANGSESEPLKTTFIDRIDLPPNGFVAWSADGKVVSKSTWNRGKRYDYCRSPEYVYFDGRGAWTEEQDACGSGCGVLRILENRSFELIPFAGSTLELGFKIEFPGGALSATALDFNEKELGPAKLRCGRDGFVFVEPVDGAFSYRLEPAKGDSAWFASRTTWDCDRFVVAPGEPVVLKSEEGKTVDWTVPTDAAPNRRVWAELEPGRFVPFLVVEPVETTFQFDAAQSVLNAELATRLPQVAGTLTFEFGAEGEKTSRPFKIDALLSTSASFDVPEPTQEGAETAIATLTASLPTGQKVEKSYSLKFETAKTFLPIAAFDFGATTGRRSENVDFAASIQRRGAASTTTLDGTGASAAFEAGIKCGDVAKSGYFMHPPYLGGATGRTFLRFDFDVPNEPTAFRATVGKRNGSDLGDGILFQLAVAEFNARGEIVPDSEKTLAETTVAGHSWAPIEADLSEYAGKRISLLVVADAGTADDTSGDWAAVAEARLETAEKAFVRTLKIEK